MSAEGQGQFRLLGQRRYAPFFWTVFLGSVNDNLLKFAVTLLLTYQARVEWLPAHLVGPVTGALFIAPSLLLSALAGRLADRHPLDRLIRRGKAAEVLMMAVAAAVVAAGSAGGMLLCLVLSGVHVTWFATVKYAYVPRHLAPHELLGGNGLLEMGLFMAIILGTLAGGVGADEETPRGVLAAVLLSLAVGGWWLSTRIPATPVVRGADTDDGAQAAAAGAGLWASLSAAHDDGRVVEAVLGISWMWFFGATFLTLFPVLTRDVLHATSSVATLLLVLTSVGIGAGALMCEGWARAWRAEKVVLLGALCMAVFGTDLALAVIELSGRAAPPVPWTAKAFVSVPDHLRLLAALVFMAVGVGWFSVPLYAQMQSAARPTHLARVIAANNVLNAVFILASAAFAAALGAAGLGPGAILLSTAALHMALAVGLLATRPRWRQAALALWSERDAREGGSGR